MPASMRRYRHSVMQRLLDAPQGFHFIQAVRLLETCLLRRGILRSEVLARHIRFRNSVSLSFAASEVEALTVDGRARQANPPAGEVIGMLQRADLTAAFFSLLGAQGPLPLHYTDRIAAQCHGGQGNGVLAFLDSLSHRSVALFYLAWIRGRVEHLTDAQGDDGYLPLQLALAGRAHGTAAPGADQLPETLAHYAALLRGRDMPGPVIGQILSAYFGLPVRIEPFSGGWETLAPDERLRLGVANNTLGEGPVLGARYRRRDQCADIVAGPLAKEDFDRFVPGAKGALALQAMLAHCATGTIRFRVRVTLRAQDVRPVTLLARDHPDPCRLGWDTFLIKKPAATDREMVYWLHGPHASQVQGGNNGK